MIPGEPPANAPDRFGSWMANGFVRVDGFLSGDQCSMILAATEALLAADDTARVVRFESNLPSSLPPRCSGIQDLQVPPEGTLPVVVHE